MARSSREEWAKRVERWVDSGLTAAEFSSEIGVNPRTLTYWKWKLRQAGSSSPRAKPKRLHTSPRFVEVTAAVETSSPIEVVVGEVTVRVPPRFDSATLCEVLAVVRGER